MAFRPPAGAYKIATGARLDADQAVAGLFPDDATVVVLDDEVIDEVTRVVTVMIEYLDN